MLTITANGQITNEDGDYTLDSDGFTVSDNFTITNSDNDFTIDSNGMRVQADSSPDPLKSYQVRSSGGGLVGFCGGATDQLFLNAVNSNQISIFGDGGVTIESGSNDITINADNDLDLSALAGDINIDSVLGDIRLLTLPTSDPNLFGALWRDGNNLRISTG